ncbi:hypothetical protein [Archangium primigenium]|uniref:hypothetical protein n=1 Tax=[Archangium] primigenium TaxID=2792470 RepID=UPI00195E5B54|nr:hypothetical protein [Archangium primigenium]MBM7118235.1 hypothetical protein [Archangium primigenium]
MDVRRMAAGALGLVGVWGAGAARACPDCPSAREVRRAVFEGGFWEPLVMVAVPFVCLGFLSALLYRVGLPGPERD